MSALSIVAISGETSQRDRKLQQEYGALLFLQNGKFGYRGESSFVARFTTKATLKFLPILE